MVLDDFKLTGYRPTIGREGEAFLANLVYKNKPVAEYADYADGGPPYITMEKTGWGMDALHETMQKINSVLPIPYMKPEETESCVECLCQMLDEGREMDKTLRKVAKEYPNAFVGMYLSGNVWTAVDSLSQKYKPGYLHTVMLTPKDSKQETALRLLKESIQEGFNKSDIDNCAAYLLLDPGTKAPIVLSADEYIKMFADGKEIEQAQDGIVPREGMDITQG